MYETSNSAHTWTLRWFPPLPQILSDSKCILQLVALPLVSFSTSVLQRCKQPSRTDNSSSVMCLGAGCIGRSGGIRDCVNGLCITDLCTGDVLGTSEDEGPCCSIVLHSFKTWNTKIESSCIPTKSYIIKISFSSENRNFKSNNFLQCNPGKVPTASIWNYYITSENFLVYYMLAQQQFWLSSPMTTELARLSHSSLYLKCYSNTFK